MLLSLVFKRCFPLFIFFVSVSLVQAKVPEWYEHRSTVYPDGLYISAVGEGDSKIEAEIAALANISMYFNVKTDVQNLLEIHMQETDGENYNFDKESTINEQTKFFSQSEFMGVQFDECFSIDGKYITLAFIERDLAYDVYLQRIKSTVAKIESLLIIAEDYNNPLSGLEAADEAVPLADYVSDLLKMARTVKKTDDTFMSYADTLVQRTYTSQEICRQNLTFQLTVKNDYENMVYTTISSLMEKAGYAISATGGVCSIPVEIIIEKQENSSGVFVYCELIVKISDGIGNDFFSYSRTFNKKGGKTESQAYRRAFQSIQEELNSSFISEFNGRLIR